MCTVSAKEPKTTCAIKCYKLDRRRNLCERHNQPVERTGPNSYKKCPKCLEDLASGRFKF
jgi:hypothetical protein